MSIFLFIIVVIILFIQNGKINRLEQLIKGKGVAPASPATQNPVVQQSAPQPASMRATPPPAMSSVPKGGASSEEASGRILGRIGIAAVVIGIAFFLKYAFDNNWIGPAGRIAIGIIIGIALLALGQWLRKKYLGYSDLLMGGGLAVLYLSVYASYALYHLADPMVAFLGMIVVTMIGAGLSIMNATQTLAIIAAIGGYLTPALIGASLIGPWIVFTYLTILNGGILAVLIYKKWSPLVLIGLIGSGIHFGVWLVFSYTSDLLVPTLLFVLVQFLIFTAASIVRLIAEKRKAEEVDYSVLTLTALALASSCYFLLMPEYEHFLSLGAVAVAILYGGIALVAYKENPLDRSLNIFLPGLAVAFLTAAIAIEFSGPWIAAWWFVESIVLYAVASKSSSRGFQVMGVVVYILGLMKLFHYILTYARPDGYVVFFNGPFIMLAMAVVTAYVISFVYYRYGSVSPDIQKRGISAFVVIANILTVYALTSQIGIYYDMQAAASVSTGIGDYSRIMNTSHTVVSIVWALYAALLTIIGFAKKYAAVRRMGLILFIITACKVVIDVWSLGEIYRVVSFIAFGVIALTISFIYVKYKDRLKEIV